MIGLQPQSGLVLSRLSIYGRVKGIQDAIYQPISDFAYSGMMEKTALRFCTSRRFGVRHFPQRSKAKRACRRHRLTNADDAERPIAARFSCLAPCEAQLLGHLSRLLV